MTNRCTYQNIQLRVPVEITERALNSVVSNAKRRGIGEHSFLELNHKKRWTQYSDNLTLLSAKTTHHIENLVILQQNRQVRSTLHNHVSISITIEIPETAHAAKLYRHFLR